MVSEKPWRSEAILRLVLSVFVTRLLGELIRAAFRFYESGPREKLWVFVALSVGAAMFACTALFVLRKPWELDRFTRSFTALLVCLYVCLTLSAFAQQAAGTRPLGNSTWNTVIAVLSGQGAALFFVWRFLREHQIGWADGFGLRLNWKMAALYGVLVAFAFLPFGWLLQEGSAKLLLHFNVPTELQPAVQAVKNSVTWFDRGAVAVSALLLAPLAEEIGFRGILYPAVKQAGFPRLAFWGVSLVFAAIHGHLATLVPLFLLALALTWVYEQTDNLLAPIAAHAMFNLLNFAKYLIFDVGFGAHG